MLLFGPGVPFAITTTPTGNHGAVLATRPGCGWILSSVRCRVHTVDCRVFIHVCAMAAFQPALALSPDRPVPPKLRESY